MRSVRWALVAAFAAAAYADDYPRQPGIDAQHYIFRVTVSDESDRISGETTVELRFVSEGVTQVALDLSSPRDGKGMTVSAVSSGGTAIPFTHSADRLVLKLPSAPPAGSQRSFTIQYQGIASGGLHIGKNKFGARTFFSWNWPTLGRNWLPMIDHPYDKATSEFIVIAPAQYQVVANGLLVETVDLGEGMRQTHWKQSVPVASWLNNIGVAQFAARQFETWMGIPLQTWVFPQDRDNGILTFEEPLRQSIEFFSNYIGRYPYQKLAAVQVNGMGGGMEHASAIFFGEREVGNRPAFALVAHEVSHQWWGDSVTEKDWDDAWLSEGFATYFTALAVEHYQGRDEFLEMMRKSRAGIFQMEKRAAVAVIHDNLSEIRTGRAPIGLVYQKGGWTLHMLRALVGDAKFREGMREYYRRYRDASASTADLRQVMERIAGQDLEWFFRQWLERAGSPVVQVVWSYDATTKKLMLDVTQTQPGEAYRLPIVVALTDGSGQTRREDLKVLAKVQHFELASDKEPRVQIDPSVEALIDATLLKRP